jgi:hypothetical protein
MPVTVRNTDILFNDATTQNTAGQPTSTALVLAATAGASHQDIGSMTIAWNTTTSGVASNGTIAGSNLRFLSSTGDMFAKVSSAGSLFPSVGTTALSGTWKAMGGLVEGRAGDGSSGYAWSPGLWLRIA